MADYSTMGVPTPYAGFGAGNMRAGNLGRTLLDSNNQGLKYLNSLYDLQNRVSLDRYKIPAFASQYDNIEQSNALSASMGSQMRQAYNFDQVMGSLTQEYMALSSRYGPALARQKMLDMGLTEKEVDMIIGAVKSGNRKSAINNLSDNNIQNKIDNTISNVAGTEFSGINKNGGLPPDINDFNNLF